MEARGSLIDADAGPIATRVEQGEFDVARKSTQFEYCISDNGRERIESRCGG